jgi:YidC/Oxa1 family membrane protein insertase
MAAPPNNPLGKPKNELSMEMRLLFAFLLMGLVLYLSNYLYKPPPPPPKATAPAGKQAAAKEQKAVAVPAPPAPKEVPPGEIQATSEQGFVVDTDIYRIRFSNRGGVVQSWVLKEHLDAAGKPLELVNPASFTKVPPPFSLAFKDDQIANTLNYALFVAKQAPGGLGVDFEFSDGKLHARKSFQFARHNFLSQVTTEVTQNGAPVEHALQWRGGFGDASVPSRLTDRHSIYYDLSQGKLLTKDAKSVKDGPASATGNYSFVGLDDRFFAFVFLPKDNTSTSVTAIKDDVANAPNGKDEAHVGVEVGGDSVNRMVVFIGPKDIDLLRKVDPKLQQLIDWGFFGVIARPLFLVLHWINDNLVHNYGWSIVAITVIINLLLLPLRFSGMRSQRKMQKLQPKIAAINAKYKGLSLRDPRKAEQNQEVMDLYKKEGVNPMGGCLPMLIQLPILYAFYKVLNVTIELRGAHWLWVTDLSQPEQLAIHILPIIMIVTQFIQQKMTPSPGMDPSQAKMMQFMPLMFGVFFYNISSGLVLYWLTSNLMGIAQQWVINKTMPAPPPTPAPALKGGSKKRA